MIRNLKAMALAVLALASFGAFGASGAQAAPEFHCQFSPCKVTLDPDGTGKTAHHVFFVSNSVGEGVALTCNQITGKATSASSSSTEALVTGIAYDGCQDSFGNSVVVKMNKCEYLVTAAGEVTVQGCEAGKKIEVEISTGCVAKVGEQGPLNGLSYHNIVEEGEETTELTAQAKVAGIGFELIGSKAQCGIDPSKTPLSAEYTTGNTIATGEPGSESMAQEIWRTP